MKLIAPNTLIQNRYLIVHLIGKGGMGEVYLAVDQRLGSAIALKRTFFSDDATLGSAFEREARTLARLRHPVLPKVSDHFTEEGTQYLVMEHISGEDISKRLEALDKPFPLSWVLFWADQLLDSLTYLHTHEPPIIHRDIKPQNLKLTDENHIVLLDFGLSKNTVGENRAATTTGSIVGYTPHYAPLEQIRGTGTDARSDIYSLSATLYQILSNSVPPDALTRAESLINGMPDPVKPVSELNAEVSKAVSDVIIKGMSVSQEQRYKNAREMQKALRDAYAHLQSDKSANTVAFVPQNQAKISPSPEAAKISHIPNISQIPSESPTVMKFSNSGKLPDDAHISSIQSAHEGNSETDFEATLRYDADLNEPSSKQSAVKNEARPADASAAINSAQDEEFGRTDDSPKAADFHLTDDFGTDEDFAAGKDFELTNNNSPDATVPLIAYETQSDEGRQVQTQTQFDSIAGQDTNKTSAATTFGSVNNYNSDKKVYPSKPILNTQKSSGKSWAIGGGIAILLFLAIGAAGIGWLMSRDIGIATENIAPTPTPAAAVSAAPTIAPTLEVVSDANTLINSEIINSETNTSNIGSDAAVSTNSARLPQTAAPTLIKPATPRKTPPIGTIKTSPSANKPPAKTPKPGRTDILQ